MGTSKNHCFNGICKSDLFKGECRFHIEPKQENDPFCMNWDKASDSCNCPKANDSEFDYPDSITGLWIEVKNKESIIEEKNQEIADQHRHYQDEIAKLKGLIEGLKETINRKYALSRLESGIMGSVEDELKSIGLAFKLLSNKEGEKEEMYELYKKLYSKLGNSLNITSEYLANRHKVYVQIIKWMPNKHYVSHIKILLDLVYLTI